MELSPLIPQEGMMTTENLNPTTEPVVPPEGTPPEAPPPGQPPAELRAHADRQEAAAKGMRTKLVEVYVKEIGLDPATGLGKAIANTYKGDDPTVEDVASYAESEYQHKKPETPQTPEQVAQTTASQKAEQLDGQAQVTTPSQAPDAAAELATQLLNPDLEKGIGRPVVESSIMSKISNWLNPPQQ
jgi:pyruvate/2-oxoglutarate dehydrogenase complex dihydrolipoamide acyltransferase (E2) component